MNIFKKPETKRSVVGQKAELVHDITDCQYGTVFIDDVRYSVRSVDGTVMIKGAMVEVIEECCGYGTTILTVKKVEV